MSVIYIWFRIHLTIWNTCLRNYLGAKLCSYDTERWIPPLCKTQISESHDLWCAADDHECCSYFWHGYHRNDNSLVHSTCHDLYLQFVLCRNSYRTILPMPFTVIDMGDFLLYDVIKWKHFPCYWPFVRGIHRSPVNSPHKDQWRGALTFSLICAWYSSWPNTVDAGNLRRHRAH